MSVFEPTLLPQAQKDQMVEALLHEFGIRVRSRYTHASGGTEWIIPCMIPGSAHSNQDREPTGAFSVTKLTYKCLGCKASGGLLWFTATMRGTTTEQARDWVNKSAGIGHLQPLHDLVAYFDAVFAKKAAREPIPTYSDRLVTLWQGVETHPKLLERQIPEQNVKALRLGWVSETNRLALPQFWRGHLVGWQTRRLDDGDGSPKYLSSPDFPKEQTVYNYDTSQDTVVVVESVMSVARHHHQAHMVSTFGASVTAEQVRLLGRYRKIILWFDNDKAGWDAVDGKRAYGRTPAVPGLGETLSRTSSVWVADSPFAEDAGDLNDRFFDLLVAGAVPYASWQRPQSLITLGKGV